MNPKEPDSDDVGGMNDFDADDMKQKGSPQLASLKAALAKRSGIKRPGALAASLGKRKKQKTGGM